MATSKLTFQIGGVFSGEAFKKANNAVATLGAQTKKATQMSTPLIGALGAMDQSASKLVRSVSGIGTAFAQLGLAGGLVAAAQMALDHYFDKAKSGLDAMVRNAEAAAQKMQKALADDIARALRRPVDAMKEVRVGAERTQKAFENMAAAALKVSKATAQTGIAGGNLEIANLEALKTNGIIGFGSDKEGAAMYAAERDIEIAEAKYKQTRLEQSTRVEQAAKEAEIAAESERLVAEKLKKAREALAVAVEEETRLSRLRDKSHAEKAAATRAQAEEMVASAERELVAKHADTIAAMEARKQADLEAARATQEASGVIQAQKRAAQDLAAAQKKAAQLAELEQRRELARMGNGDVADLNAKIAAEREAAAKWEQDFGGLRGKSIKEQQRALRDMANAKGRDGADGWERTTQAKELERLERMAETRRGSMTKGQLEKMEQLRQLRDIRRGKNPHEEAIRKFEEEKKRAIGKMEEELKAIERKIAGLS